MLLNVSDAIQQTGHYPLRSMSGSANLWLGRSVGAGMALSLDDEANGCTWSCIVVNIIRGLGRMNPVDLHQTECTSHWRKNANRYRPAGIGSTRGNREFTAYHGRLFFHAFADRRRLALDNQILPDGLRDYVPIEQRGDCGCDRLALRLCNPQRRWIVKPRAFGKCL